MRTFSIFIGLIVIVLGNTSFADHPVSGLQAGGSGPIITSPGKVAKKGTGAIAINFQHVDFDNFSPEELSEFAEQDEDVHGTSSLQRLSLDAAFGVTDKLTLGASIPYVKRNNLRESGHHEEGEDGDDEEEEFELLGDAEDIGDVQLFGQYQLFSNDTTSLHVSTLFGVKLPTGETNEESPEGERLEVELQPGTGSIDPFLGFAMSKRLGNWDAHSNILYTYSSEGSQDTTLGDVFNYNFALTTPFSTFFDGSDHDHSAHEHDELKDKLNLVLELNGEWRERIDIDNETEDNSGGNLVYLSPGMTFNTHGWLFSALAGWPIVDDLNGEQSDPEFRFVFKVTKLIGQ